MVNEMKVRQQANRLVGKLEGKIEYPCGTMAICLLFIYLSPFTSLYLNYVAFAICLYRIIRYDESVFAVDYCVLAGVSYIFLSTGRVSLLAWLSILAAIWYMIKNGIKQNISFVLLIILLDYMLLRMQGEINTFVLCFSQLMLLYVLTSTQKREWIVPSAQAFCGSVILSSIYGLVFRNASQIRSLLGSETVAYWGSSLTRFQGLFRDPNYYMTMLTIAIALVAMLCINRYISRISFVVNTVCLVYFGALTYSKTFIIVLAISTVIFVIMLFYKKHFLLGIMSIAGIAVASVLLSNTLFSVTLYRITSTNNLYDLTTGRSELLTEYIEVITGEAHTFFFGAGLSADILEKGTHNLYLEIVYYLGFVGLILIVLYIASLVHLLSLEVNNNRQNPNGVFKYAVLIAFLLLFSSLQGMTFAITYVMLYLSVLAIEIVPNESLHERTSIEVEST